MLKWITTKIIKGAEEARQEIENERLLQSYGIDKLSKDDLFPKIVKSLEAMAQDRWQPLERASINFFDSEIQSAIHEWTDIPPCYVANRAYKNFSNEVLNELPKILREDVSENFEELRKLFYALDRGGLYINSCLRVVQTYTHELLLKGVNDILAQRSSEIAESDRQWRTANPSLALQFPPISELHEDESI
ncbi:MAG: hypothetical protein NTV34_00760 [Proteobacteria bacterium]|nr:hypothetical protein [Pseudomonadota bacterium]